MTKPRLGVAIVIDNMSTPGTEADVAALKDVYHTAGFEVYTYSNCDSKVGKCSDVDELNIFIYYFSAL